MIAEQDLVIFSSWVRSYPVTPSQKYIIVVKYNVVHCIHDRMLQCSVCIRPKPSLELRIPQDFIMVVVVVVWLSLTGTLVLVVGTLELVVVSGFIFHCCVLVLIPDLISNK